MNAKLQAARTALEAACAAILAHPRDEEVWRALCTARARYAALIRLA